MLRERGYDCFTILAQSAPGMNLALVQAELGLLSGASAIWHLCADRKLEFHAQSDNETVTVPL